MSDYVPGSMTFDDVDDLVIAARCLARMVRDDNPAGHDLAEIVGIWGGASSDEIDAVDEMAKLFDF